LIPRSNTNFLRRDYWFGQVDSRPLSAFRIVFALLLLKDALYHLPLVRLFYSDDGVVPRAVLLELARDDRFSLMDAMPHEWMAALFFLAWIAVLVCLLLGYRTRLVTVLNFFILMSIHERDVYVLTGADTMMRALSFWAMFIPLEQDYSLDAMLARSRGQPLVRSVFAFPVRMIQVQVALVYLTTGLLKLTGAQWQSGEALGYVMQLDTILLPVGVWFRGIAPDGLLRLMSWGTMLMEVAFIVLVFAPIGQPALRVLALVSMALLHLGIGVMLSIPDFSLVMLVSYIVFFEPRWIEAIARRLKRWLAVLPIPVSDFGRDTSESEALQDVTSTPESSETDNLPLVSPSADWKRALVVAFLALVMLGVIWWNVDTIYEYTGQSRTMPPRLETLMWYSGVWQYWDLFAPLPLQIDGWMTIPGVFEDGTVLDLRTGQPPDDAMQRYTLGPLVRWEKFEENVYNNAYNAILLSWGRYYCHEYNAVQALPEGHRLATLEIRYRFRRSHAPGEPPNEYEDDLLWSHWCYDQYAPP
jgi:hypothetical protein